MAESWTHALCDVCWNLHRPGKLPARMLEPRMDICCACNIPTQSGIYVREKPDDMPCKGISGKHVRDDN